MKIVGFSPVAVAVACAGLGCAHAPPEPPREPAAPHDRVVIATDAPPPPEAELDPALRPRPRLSQTVTLGQQSYEPYEPQADAPAGPGVTNVVVNNNVYIDGYGNGYGGYYYGGYYPGPGYAGGGFAHGHATGGVRGGQNAPGVPVGGTAAAPGQTPHVGGSWAPPPSYGPRAPR